MSAKKNKENSKQKDIKKLKKIILSQIQSYIIEAQF